MKLKIAVLGAKGIPHPGGIELVMEEVGTRLVQKGHQFDIFVRDHYMVNNSSTHYRGINLPRSSGYHHKVTDAITHSISALPVIMKKGYDIVYINSVGLSTLAWIPKLTGQKVVVHTHGLDWKREKWGFFAKKMIRFSAWTTAHLPDLTICVCKEDKRFFEETYRKTCLYIPNGVPGVHKRSPSEILKWGLEKNNFFLFMARLVPEKGAHFLLEAWKLLPAEYKKKKKLVIAGDNNHKDGYATILKQYKMIDGVVFTGFATGRIKEELLTNALCFVQPSTIEGMPLSILEAMGYGLMIIASDIQENQDALCGHGFIFQSKNIQELSDKLFEILSLNDDVIGSMGKEICKFGVDNYNWDKISNIIEKELIKIVRKK